MKFQATRTSLVQIGDFMKRSEIKEEMKWDLSSLYKSESDFNKDFKYLEDNYLKYKDFEGRLNNAKDIYDFFGVFTRSIIESDCYSLLCWI